MALVALVALVAPPLVVTGRLRNLTRRWLAGTNAVDAAVGTDAANIAAVVGAAGAVDAVTVICAAGAADVVALVGAADAAAVLYSSADAAGTGGCVAEIGAVVGVVISTLVGVYTPTIDVSGAVSIGVGNIYILLILLLICCRDDLMSLSLLLEVFL